MTNRKGRWRKPRAAYLIAVSAPNCSTNPSALRKSVTNYWSSPFFLQNYLQEIPSIVPTNLCQPKIKGETTLRLSCCSPSWTASSFAKRCSVIHSVSSSVLDHTPPPVTRPLSPREREREKHLFLLLFLFFFNQLAEDVLSQNRNSKVRSGQGLAFH